MSDKLIAENRKARFNYSIGETVEAGLVLTGTEVRSCRLGKVTMGDAYAALRNGELVLQNLHISEYSHGNRSNHDPKRTRKLLVHKRELAKLINEMNSGASLIPLKMYFKGPWAKVLLGVGRGKKIHDKRQSIKEREAKREIERRFRG